MKIRELAENALKLTILSKKICEATNLEAEALTQKVKVLYLISDSKKVSPSIIKNKLGIAKSNLAVICKQLIYEKKIDSVPDLNDKRILYYSLTEIGKKFLEEQLNIIQKNIIACYSDKKEELLLHIKETNKILDN